jgi:hypothetical protein
MHGLKRYGEWSVYQVGRKKTGHQPKTVAFVPSTLLMARIQFPLWILEKLGIIQRL